jgi:cytochrome c-type biogenesis protein
MIGLSLAGLAAAFGAGVVSFMSPCVAPLVPGYLTLITGSIGENRTLAQRRLHFLWPSLIFVLGFTLVFVTLGASASVFGTFLDDYRRQLIQVSGGVMLLMGMVVLWGFRLPLLMRERKLHFTPRRFTSSETLLMGMVFGLGWTPCFGPILASILVFTSTVDGVREGTALLFAYSLGLGLPFVLAGLGLSQFQQVVRFFVRRAQAVAVLSGGTLIVLGFLFMTGQIFRIAIVSQQLLGQLAAFGAG